MTRGRAVRAAAMTAIVAVGLTGCTGDPGSPAPAETTTAAPAVPLREGVPTIDERFTPDIPAELRVRNPKDATGIDPCDLLTREQVGSFGLDPDTARGNPARYGDSCIWKYRDGSTSAGVDLTTDPNASKLPDIYRLRENDVVFEIRQIAGHPAVRSDRVPNECNLAVAIADYQIVGVNAYLDSRILPDPCAPAVRMAELIIANLAARP